jgi:hypothetical protein
VTIIVEERREEKKVAKKPVRKSGSKPATTKPAESAKETA